MFLVSVLLVGCGQEPEPAKPTTSVAERPKAVAEERKAAEPTVTNPDAVAKAKSAVVTQPESKTTKAEPLTREQAIAVIEKLGGKVETIDELLAVDFSSTEITDADLENLRGMTGLGGLSLQNTKVADTGLEHLKTLTSLKVLVLRGTRVTGDGLEHLKEQKNLETLDLGETAISDVGLEHLKGMTKLEMLGLDGTQVTGEGVRELQQALPNCNITPQIVGEKPKPESPAGSVAEPEAASPMEQLSIEEKRALAELQRLNPSQGEAIHELVLLGSRFFAPGKILLIGQAITDSKLEHVKGLTNREGLQLRETLVTDAGLEHLKGLTNLKELHLWDAAVSDAGLVHLKAMTKLEMLGLKGTDVTNAGLKHLRELTNLRTLTFDNSQVSDEGIKEFQQALPNCSIEVKPKEPGPREARHAIAVIEKLGGKARRLLFPRPGSEDRDSAYGLYVRLDNTQLTDEGLVQLKGLTIVTELFLSNTQVTDAGLRHMKELPRLSSLQIRNTAVTDSELEHLKDLPNIVYLDLGGTRVTDAGLQHLKGMTKLSSLMLADCPQVTDKGVKELQQALPGLRISPSLYEFEHISKRIAKLKEVYPNQEAAIRELDASRYGGFDNKTGLTLSLSGPEVTDAVLKHIEGLTNLRELNLPRTQVTDAGLVHLKGLTNLQNLSLWQICVAKIVDGLGAFLDQT